MGGDPFNHVRVAVKKLRDDAMVPCYSSAEAAGADLFACEEVILKPGERALVRTGIAIELSPGYQAEIRSRSGLALKSGIVVLNSPGTVDSDYRGEIGMILFNANIPNWRSAIGDFVVRPGDRIAQMVIMPVMAAEFELVTDELSATERGEGGFGSTGVSGDLGKIQAGAPAGADGR